MAKGEAGPRHWMPHTTPEVWVVVRQGDWGEDIKVYATEDLATQAMVKIIQTELPRVQQDDVREAIVRYFDVGEWDKGITVFVDHMSGWGNYLDVYREVVRRR